MDKHQRTAHSIWNGEESMPKKVDPNSEVLKNLEAEVCAVLETVRRNKLRKYRIDQEAHDGTMLVPSKALWYLDQLQAFSMIGTAAADELRKVARTLKPIRLPATEVARLLLNTRGYTPEKLFDFAEFRPVIPEATNGPMTVTEVLEAERLAPEPTMTLRQRRFLDLLNEIYAKSSDVTLSIFEEVLDEDLEDEDFEEDDDGYAMNGRIRSLTREAGSLTKYQLLVEYTSKKGSKPYDGPLTDRTVNVYSRDCYSASLNATKATLAFSTEEAMDGSDRSIVCVSFDIQDMSLTFSSFGSRLRVRKLFQNVQEIPVTIETDSEVFEGELVLEPRHSASSKTKKKTTPYEAIVRFWSNEKLKEGPINFSFRFSVVKQSHVLCKGFVDIVDAQVEAPEESDKKHSLYKVCNRIKIDVTDVFPIFQKLTGEELFGLKS